MKISIIGAGNVAWHLAQALDKSGHEIQQVYSRSIKNAKSLCEKLYIAEPCTTLDFATSKATVFILCIPDDVIPYIASQIAVPQASMIVHTSGGTSIEILAHINNATETGVLYPVQTFTKGINLDLSTVPFCIEGNNEKAEKMLETIAFSICENVCYYTSADRAVLHLAAVFACNFTQHMVNISKYILKKEGLDFVPIMSLIKETLSKSIADDEQYQSGPASRNDLNTMELHMQLLKKHPDFLQLYKQISQSIIHHKTKI
ncbi:MAG: Rossmann-like and DUF2520 domain-containing protein [Cytophagales bacterium]|nr:Rossmann-like and DUF2520 domain-containing protein [Cytophagales bacterium]